ncbi:MAG: phosphoribosylformimino-5-aminoimidazole carboxamide ribotide isomerase [Pseudohongiellaceae bacterium]|jgi:phosphoribosylformimino-5-aminoimidazole carboxamide ribotide isomerase
MKFRPCIDLHNGKVVQIVGGSLQDDNNEALETNFVSSKSPAEFASLYAGDGLTGGHVISLGAGNKNAALEALTAFPDGMHYGGGVNPDNAGEFLDAGASHVIVTSWIFDQNKLDLQKLSELSRRVGKQRLVLDLSCRLRGNDFFVVSNRWQTFTDEKVDASLLSKLSEYCVEYLVHGVDVEGKSQGIQEDLIRILGKHSPLPVTYAGGVSKLSDLDLVNDIGDNKVDLTIGSALDIFGGEIPYEKVIEWSKKNS